jgi:nucleotide-binding universal stress UspA family protein
MPYKTLLVHLNDRRRAEHLLKPTIALASRWNAHLVGLHVYPSIPQLSAFGTRIGGEAVGSLVSAAREEADHIRAIFDRMTANQPFVAEWQSIKAMGADLAELVMERGRAADLIVTSQSDPDWEMTPVLDFPERLAIESGRPVLVVPNSGRFESIGRNVIVAWSGTRESARATYDALPILVEAEEVRVLGVAEPRHRNGAPAPLPDTAIAASLARHGIKAVAVRSEPGNKSVSAEILARVADIDGDLLVMGAYGHSRFSELVFGGVTRHIARHMTVPTLFSH